MVKKVDFNNDKVSSNCIGQNLLVGFSMLYMSIMLCNAVLTNRYIGSDSLFVLGGSFTSPFIFILGDIIAEVYGYKTAKSIILLGFGCQTIFVLVCQCVVNAPYPGILTPIAYQSYLSIFGMSLFRINISGFLAYMAATLINAKILTRWKFLLKGKRFWLRSLGASTFAEAIYTAIAIIMMQVNSIRNEEIFQLIILSFLIKISYSILLAFPANILVNFIKDKTGVDVYDFKETYTPFKFLRPENE